ncbi:MAG: electron transfer flavoprotein subunit alpha [Bacteroidetes bacterium CG02_land_8_20_14_3_00_31_25]|nr:electron transfer flavoprotein subunit alpha/FixB family protein [Bacteroidota bacterium]PIV62145.1 MAG: electron transfer flavoprotein subunit alpha [Bacteroidetes bacterium CG02_land_8_20_14_3_00_31_25]PIX35377.1 MAG: electron transfer flavoprotein subunit alpha [Bacteroidetes bacterium CG_4_8_14_3_um_filter_31_14]PIY04523.1 MAG: electron transfer flavoprotein subunit alpha [Bacteroidetes bacterium CG_4_10_14_3_um_filter_31_20]
MSILVFAENWDGKFKKQTFELVSYGNSLAKLLNSSVVALSIGKVEDDELKKLGSYGASKILTINDSRLYNLDNKAYTIAIAQAVTKENATVIILPQDNTGKAIASRISARLKAGLVSGVTGLPTSIEPFTVVKKSFTSKAYANIVIKTPVKIITLFQNAFGIIESPASPVIEAFAPEINDSDIKTIVKEVNKVTGKILLTDAEIVVSGGRGMKGPENWGAIEELATLLNGATACSRPVSDEGWRSHEEHVGQTGKIIAPNIYFACGISGAIQHLGGVSSSKYIVAINKDPEAPIFEVADYGIVGDVQKILPEIINAVKELKS